MNFTQANVSIVGENLNTFTRRVILSNQQTTAEIEFELEVNDSAGGHGTITAVVPDGTGYQVGSYSNSAAVSIIDDESLPVLTINNPDPVSESAGSVTFNIRSNAQPTGDSLRVQYGLREPTGDFLVFQAPSYLPLEQRVLASSQLLNFTEVSGGSGSYEADLVIELDNDEVAEANGSVSVTLVSDTNFTYHVVTGNNDVGVVQITDDDTILPTITITSDAAGSTGTGVTEGFSFDFEVESDQTISGTPLEISFTPTYTGATDPNLAITGTTVSIPVGEDSATGTVTMDSIFDIGSSDNVNIVITIATNANYTVGDPGAITVAVKDNDATSAAEPSVEISGPNYIAEGDTVEFTVTASEEPNNDTTVNVQFEVRGDFIGASETNNSTKPAVIANTGTTGTVSFETKADAIDGADGLITATILDGNDYVKSNTAAENEASVVILDALPVISVSAPDAVDETDDATSTFNVTLAIETDDFVPLAGKPLVIDGLTIENVSDSSLHNYYQSHTSNIQFTDANDSTNRDITVEVTISGDDVYIAWGEISIALASGDEYTADSNNNSATVTVREDEQSDISVAIEVSDYVVGGDNIDATLVATNNSSNDVTGLMVDFQAVNVTGSYLNYTNAKVSIDVTAGATTREPVSIPTTAVPDGSEGVISLEVSRGNGYETASTTPVEVRVLHEAPLPVLSIADANEILAGTSANFVVTSSIPVTGNLMVAYTPENMGGNYLNETDGTDTTKPNTNSGLQRVITLEFNGSNTATLSFATVDDSADVDGAGSIKVTLNADPEATDTYMVSQVQDEDNASIAVIRPGRVPTVSITGGDPINEGQDAVFTVSTNEIDATLRTQDLVVNVTTSYTGTNFISGTPSPTVSIPGGSKSAQHTVPTTNDGSADGNFGYITVTLETGGVSYQLGETETTSARIGVRDNAGVRSRLAEAYIADAAATVEGDEMVFTVNLTRRPVLNTNVYYSIHSDSTAVAGEDFTQPALNYITFRRGSRFPIRRPGELTKQIRIPIIHDNYDELDGETVVIELTRATNNYSIDSFENRAMGTITDHADDVAMVSVLDTAGLEGDTGNKDVPVTISLNIPSTRNIEVDWATSVSPSGTNLAAADDFLVESSSTPAVITAGQLTGTFDVEFIGDTDPTVAESDETFTVTISGATNGAVIDNATATVTIKSDEIPVLTIANGADITEADPSDPAVSAQFTVTSSLLPATPNNALTVYYTQAGGSYFDSSALSSTSASIEFSDNGSGAFTGTLPITIENDDDPEANGEINVVLIEEQSPPTNTYSVDPANDSATVNVSDDDSPTPVLSIAGPANAVTEGDNAVAEFVITSRDGSASDAAALNPSNPIIILYSVMDAAEDFLDTADEGDQSTGTAVNFTSDGNGNYIYRLNIPVGDDNVVQANGDITVTLRADDLSPETYTVDTDTSDQSATATIENDDSRIASFTLANYSEDEGGTLSFVVTLNEKVPDNTSTLVYYEILDSSTATAGVDFIAPSLSYVQFRGYNPSSATIPDPNNLGGMIPDPDYRVPMIPDPDNPGEMIPDPRYTIPMIPDPNNPRPMIPNPNHVAEANYTGNIQQTIEFQLPDNELHELDKTINLRLTRATGTTAVSDTNNTATGTIEDEDFIYVSIDERSAPEGDSGNTVVPVTVRLSTLSTSDLTVNWEAKSVVNNSYTS